MNLNDGVMVVERPGELLPCVVAAYTLGRDFYHRGCGWSAFTRAEENTPIIVQAWTKGYSDAQDGVPPLWPQFDDTGDVDRTGLTQKMVGRQVI